MKFIVRCVVTQMTYNLMIYLTIITYVLIHLAIIELISMIGR
jgi:hypothetical protein